MKKVYLVGAGPGDEELITVKGIKAISKADVILYDRLVNSNLLRYAREDAEIYYCGKKPGSHYKTQDEINEMLVKYAEEGKIVTRVKGGDPYVFGRGGEEALALLERGIEFEVVPGVTSPIAVLNYAGIPITQRGISQGFHVFTAMTAEKLDIDWKAVSRLRGTLVFMMGLSNLERIVEELLKAGMRSDMPSAVVMKGTTSKQKKVVATLVSIVEEVKKAKLESPCIIAFGESIEFSDKLDWYKKKPLSGYKVCTTRSKEQTAELREKLLDAGAEVTEVHSIETKVSASSMDSYMDSLSDYDHILLTSVNAVNYFFDMLLKKGYDIRKLRAEFPAIGEKTAEALRRRGIVPAFTAEEYYMESLLEELSRRVKCDDRVLYPRSNKSRNIACEYLKPKGVKLDCFNLYSVERGRVDSYTDLDDVDLILFTSPSTVRNTIEMFGLEVIGKKELVSIGPVTQMELERVGLESKMSDVHDIDGMLEFLISLKGDETDGL